MRFVFFTHSLRSDWNHGNAHFQRGVMRELRARGHAVTAFEPADGWSRTSLLADQGPVALARFADDFPELDSRAYAADAPLAPMLDGADVVIVHEWTDPALIASIGRARIRGGRFVLLFHDTHHRAVSAPDELERLDLAGYDAVLAFGGVLTETYRRRGWGACVFTWHEAADTRLFRPHPQTARTHDLVWIGNWGDGERTQELRRFLIEPARRLELAGTVHGVRYPASALAELREAGLAYRGWIANADVPVAFARHRATVHVPRGPYVRDLPGIPTIRVFEALACGIPLVCAPWDDAEGLFRPGRDYLTARNGEEMAAALRAVLHEDGLAQDLARSGLERIRARHTCAHRVDELLGILDRVGLARPVSAPEPAA